MTTKINIFRSGEIQNYTPWVLTVKVKKNMAVESYFSQHTVGALKAPPGLTDPALPRVPLSQGGE